MTRRGTAVIAFALTIMACAPMARATPPDQIFVQDELFGISPDHIYLLRKSHDNLGLYTADVRAVALIAIDRRTTDEQIWPVWRSRSTPDLDRDDTGMTVTTSNDTLPGAVDPYQILRAAGGAPVIAAPLAGFMDLIAAPDSTGDATIPAAFQFNDTTRFAPDPAALSDGVGPALDRFIQTMGDYTRFGPLAAADMIVGLHFTASECGYTESSVLVGAPDMPPLNLIRVTCPAGAELEGGVAASLWMMVLPEGRD